MKLVVSGGGTGGHVYPALAVIEALLEPEPAGGGPPLAGLADILWIGSQGGIEEEMVTHYGVAFAGLPAGGVRGMDLTTAVRNAARIAGSLIAARKILQRFQPDVVLVTGGYASVAVGLAARTLRRPVLIYLPDVVPGLAIRLLSRVAQRIAVSVAESARFFAPGRVAVTGYPVRSAIQTISRAQARRALDLDPEATTLLVFGGSRGARSINQALVAGLPQLLPHCQVVHISGKLDADWVASVGQELPEPLRARYHPYGYLDDMPLALAAADLAVCRAGAATLGELPAAGLPAILVPYPYSGQHQLPNAEYLARGGAATILPDADLRARLVPAILDLLTDRDRLAAMRQSARSMARPQAAQAIAEELRMTAQRAAPRQARG